MNEDWTHKFNMFIFQTKTAECRICNKSKSEHPQKGHQYMAQSVRATKRSQILCAECGKYSYATKWKETSIPCEDCGEHNGIECPKCGEKFDDSNEFLIKGKVETTSTDRKQWIQEMEEE